MLHKLFNFIHKVITKIKLQNKIYEVGFYRTELYRSYLYNGAVSWNAHPMFMSIFVQ